MDFRFCHLLGLHRCIRLSWAQHLFESFSHGVHEFVGPRTDDGWYGVKDSHEGGHVCRRLFRELEEVVIRHHKPRALVFLAGSSVPPCMNRAEDRFLRSAERSRWVYGPREQMYLVPFAREHVPPANTAAGRVIGLAYVSTLRGVGTSCEHVPERADVEALGRRTLRAVE